MDEYAPFLINTASNRIVQIHPSYECNLQCLHCYSNSTPEYYQKIDYPKLIDFIQYAKSIGYSYIGLSGGEPFLWDRLHEFVTEIKDMGLKSAIITNGQLLTSENTAGLEGVVDTISVSIDGSEATHNAVRGSRTYEKAVKALDTLYENNINASIAFTFNNQNFREVESMYRLAALHHVVCLEIHPLLELGRTKTSSLRSPDSVLLRAIAWQLSLLSDQYPNGPVVIIDSINKPDLVKSKWLADWNCSDMNNFPDLVPSITVDPSGNIKPFIIGFPDKYIVSNISSHDFTHDFDCWMNKYHGEIQEVINELANQMTHETGLIFDLFGEMIKRTE